MKRSTTEKEAACAGIFGAFWLAAGISVPVVGWMAFLVSNVLWIKFARENGHSGLRWQHVAFSLTSVLGIFNTWGIA